MKKVIVVFVLIMAVLAVNAQTTEPTTTKEIPVRTTVLVADLQKAITDNIETDYVGYTIKEATKVVKKDVVKYEVVVVKDDKTETLVYDNEGKFLKKLSPEKVKE
jgi:hypothetical protein